MDIRQKNILIIWTVLFFISLFISSCDVINSKEKGTDVNDSVDVVEEVELIKGADNVTLIVNGSDMSYFNLEFQGILDDTIIEDGFWQGWCIDWKTPISSQNGTYHGIKLYSTYGVEQWKGVNAFINMVDSMKLNDSEITYREIQATIWTLRPHPAFDLDNINYSDLPSDMIQDGELLFNAEKVKEIVDRVKSASKSFQYGEEDKFAVIAETPVDVQTVITVVTKK